MLKIHEFSIPLSGAEKREIQFVNFVGNKIKVKDKWIKAVFIKGQTSVREEDYYKIFSQ